MADLVIVRHGQSLWNLENKFTGNVDIGLTALGRAEATITGKKLRSIWFATCFSSDLARARESLDLILKESMHPNVAIIHTSAFNERNYGNLQGLDKTRTAALYGPAQVDIWRRSYDIAPPGGESLKMTAVRVIDYYDKQVAPRLREGENVLIVAHGNSLRALMMYLEKMSASEIEKVDIPTGIPRRYVLDADLQVLKTVYL